MTADEARKLSGEAVNSETVERHLKPVYDLIAAAARSGKRRIEIGSWEPTSMKALLEKRLRADGFKVESYSDPRESYHTISW